MDLCSLMVLNIMVYIIEHINYLIDYLNLDSTIIIVIIDIIIVLDIVVTIAITVITIANKGAIATIVNLEDSVK